MTNYKIVDELKNSKCDLYTFYYYMKDFSKRISDLAEYTVNGK